MSLPAVGVIGTGHIAAPMVRLLARKGHPVIVSARNADIAAHLAAELGVTVAPNQTVLDRAEIVLLCLRPGVAAEVLGRLQFRADHQLVSVMAGISEAEIRALCAPAATRVQTIPLPFLDAGGCPLPAHGDAPLLEALFAPENPVLPVASEAALNAHFALCTLVPGVLEAMAVSADWLGVATGDPARAEAYTAQLLAGYLAALPRTTGALAGQRDALATPDTLSLTMVEALRDAGLPDVLRDTYTRLNTRLEGAAT